METLLKGIFDSELTSVISIADFILCIGVSLIIGLIIHFVKQFNYSAVED